MNHRKHDNRDGTGTYRSWRVVFPLLLGFSLLLTLDGYGQQTNPRITFEETKANAENGDVAAQDAIGVRYATGDGIALNNFLASRWFRRAAEQGDARAQYHLALYYYDRQRVDYHEATIWYRKAAEQGHADSQNQLGVMYAQAKGVTEDLDEAVKWFRLAAEQGNASAKVNLEKTFQRKGANGSWQADRILQPQTARPLRTLQSTNEITTTDNVAYKAVSILKVEPDGLVIEHALQHGGIGLAKVRFENLSTDLQQKYGYDAQTAVAYQTQHTAGQRQWLAAFQAQEAQAKAALKAREEDNFRGRMEIDRLENERRKTEAAQAQADADKKRAEAAQAQADADRIRATTPPQVNVQVNNFTPYTAPYYRTYLYSPPTRYYPGYWY